jgi:hypothetical protein
MNVSIRGRACGGLIALPLLTPSAALAQETAAPQAAQPPPPGQYTHDGFYLRYTLGVADSWLFGSGPRGQGVYRDDGIDEIFALGGTLPNGLVLGGALSAVVSNAAVLGTYGVLVDWFPAVRGGWHVGGLFGLAYDLTRTSIPNASPENLTPDPPALSTFGFGATLLGGYDAWITPQCSLGVTAVLASSTGVANVGGYDYRLTPIWFGLMASVLYH